MMITMPANVRIIVDIIQDAGYPAFIYGACVREAVLGRSPINWEITTSALPPDLVLLFDDRPGFSAIPAASDYGTVTLCCQGDNYRLSTFRSSSGHRFAENIAEELSQHDFTLNALAYNDRQGLIDPFGGIRDIEQRLIRCVGDPAANFAQDPVRMLRALRFEAQLGFSLDESLLMAITSYPWPEDFDFCHSEKVCTEFIQMLLTEQPSRSIRRLHQLGMLRFLLPELLPTIGFDTRSSHHDKDVFEHTMLVLDHSKPDLTLRLAALLHDVGKPACLTIDAQGEGHCYGHAGIGADIAREALSRLNFDQKTVGAVSGLVKEHMNDFDNASELSIKRLIQRVGPDNICNLFELLLSDIEVSPLSGRDIDQVRSVRVKCWEVLTRSEPLTTRDLAINYYDLMPYFNSGKAIGAALDYLLEKVTRNPALNDQDKLFALLDIGLPESTRED